MMDTAISVNIANLKSQLSFFLSLVKQGKEVTVLERKTPIAKIISSSETESDFKVMRAKNKPSFLKTIKIHPIKCKVNAVTLLREDRDRR